MAQTETESKRFAYVTVFYGENSSYLFPAITLGYGLSRMGSPHDRVILITPDVSDDAAKILSLFYTKVIRINYVEPDPKIFNTADPYFRFSKIFTKLEVLRLTQYDSIVLLDLDMLVLKNMDDVFNLRAPAGVVSGLPSEHGKILRRNEIIGPTMGTSSPRVSADRMRSLGLKVNFLRQFNAGFLLLKPDQEEYDSIIGEISKRTAEDPKYKYPEQEFLTVRYAGRWTCVHNSFNFMLKPTVENYLINSGFMNENEIRNVHFLSYRKPWTLLLREGIQYDDTVKRMKESKFIEKYYLLWMENFNAAELVVKNTTGLNVFDHVKMDDISKI